MTDDVNLPTIPDKVVDRIRKGKPVALEEVSEAAAEMRDTAAAERTQPVHAEDLKPITKAQAASLVSGTPDGKLQHGVLPRAPSSRRVIPAPFRRPSISMQVPWEPVPSWGYCRADEVQEGDIVPDLGRVIEVGRSTRYADAREMVPVHQEDREGRVLVHTALAPEDSVALQQAFGGLAVAVGTNIVLTGAGGNQMNLDAGEQVRVFRIQQEGESGGGTS